MEAGSSVNIPGLAHGQDEELSTYLSMKAHQTVHETN